MESFSLPAPFTGNRIANALRTADELVVNVNNFAHLKSGDDWAPAIQAAIDAAAEENGGMVFLPPRPTPYEINGTIILKSRVVLRGGGIGATVIRAADSAELTWFETTAMDAYAFDNSQEPGGGTSDKVIPMIVTDPNANTERCGIDGLTVDFNSDGQFDLMSDVDEFFHTGILLYRTKYSWAHRCRAYDVLWWGGSPYGNWQLGSGFASLNCEYVLFDKCVAEKCNQEGFGYRNKSRFAFSRDCHAIRCNTNAFAIMTLSDHTYITDCYAWQNNEETTAKRGLRIHGAKHSYVRNLYLDTNTGDGIRDEGSENTHGFEVHESIIDGFRARQSDASANRSCLFLGAEKTILSNVQVEWAGSGQLLQYRRSARDVQMTNVNMVGGGSGMSFRNNQINVMDLEFTNVHIEAGGDAFDTWDNFKRIKGANSSFKGQTGYYQRRASDKTARAVAEFANVDFVGTDAGANITEGTCKATNCMAKCTGTGDAWRVGDSGELLLTRCDGEAENGADFRRDGFAEMTLDRCHALGKGKAVKTDGGDGRVDVYSLDLTEHRGGGATGAMDEATGGHVRIRGHQGYLDGQKKSHEIPLTLGFKGPITDHAGTDDDVIDHLVIPKDVLLGPDLLNNEFSNSRFAGTLGIGELPDEYSQDHTDGTAELVPSIFPGGGHQAYWAEIAGDQGRRGLRKVAPSYPGRWLGSLLIEKKNYVSGNAFTIVLGSDGSGFSNIAFVTGFDELEIGEWAWITRDITTGSAGTTRTLGLGASNTVEGMLQFSRPSWMRIPEWLDATSHKEMQKWLNAYYFPTVTGEPKSAPDTLKFGARAMTAPGANMTQWLVVRDRLGNEDCALRVTWNNGETRPESIQLYDGVDGDPLYFPKTVEAGSYIEYVAGTLDSDLADVSLTVLGLV